MVGVTTRVTWIGWFRKPLVVAEEGTSTVVDEGTSAVVDEGTSAVLDEGTSAVVDEGTSAVVDEGTSVVLYEGTSVVVAVGMFVLINGDTYSGVGVEPVLVETHALCIKMNFYLSNIRQCHE